MGISRFTTMISQALVPAALLLGSSVASAATVSVLPVAQDVFEGDTVTVDLVAFDLVNAAGGSMDVSWDASVLTMTGGTLTDAQVNIADVFEGDGPWDNPDTSTFSDRGVVSPGLLSGLRVGTFNFVTGDAPLATLTFTAVGAPGSSTDIIVGDGAGAGGGWSPPIDGYNPATVNVVNTSVIPVPAAVWLFGSGLLGLVGIARRRRG